MAKNLLSVSDLFAVEDLSEAVRAGLWMDSTVTGILIGGIRPGVDFNQTGSKTGLNDGVLRFTKAQAAQLAITGLPANSDTDQALSITPLIAGPSKITVRVSGDAAMGILPKMALYVDGVQIGSTTQISASRAAGQWQDVTFSTRLTGKSEIKVAFLNDTQSGDTGDRNLFVDKITVNGQSLVPESANYVMANQTITGQSALYWQGALAWKTALLDPTLIDQVPSGRSKTMMVKVDAVADMPLLTTAPASGVAGSWIKLPITAALADNDGSETLSIQIANLPDGAALRSGSSVLSISNHAVTLTPQQLTSLDYKAPANFAGQQILNITAIAQEKAYPGMSGNWEGNSANNIASIQSDLTVTTSIDQTIPASDYLRTHRFFADTSPWNSKISTTLYEDVPALADHKLVLTSWLQYGGNVSIYYADQNDPVRQVMHNPDTWKQVYNGTWQRFGNNATTEQQILSSSTELNPYPANPYSTQKAGLYWYNGGLPQSYDKADPGPTFAHIPDEALPTNTRDGYTVIIQPDGSALEMYAPIKLSSGNWVGLMYSFTDALNGQGVGAENGRTASMVENYAGVLRARDLEAPAIDHALALAAPSSMLKTAYTGPALAFDSNPDYSGTLAMGSRLALPKDLNIDDLGLTTDIGKKVAHAAQDYGMIIVDRGGSEFTLIAENNPQSSAMNGWNNSAYNDFTTILHHADLAYW